MSEGKTAKDMIAGLMENGFNDSYRIGLVCSGFVSDILKGKTTFLKIIEELENILTSPELEKHNVGLEVLAHILELLPKNLLSVKELDFITQYFCAQVKQHHSFISNSLRGLIFLVEDSQLSKESLHAVTTTLFNNVVLQTQKQTDRRVFYNILQYIVLNRLEDYSSTSSEFLFSVISSVDGERDPRNLMLLFSFIPIFYSSITLEPLTEDAFEVVSCYFPIDFHSSGTEHGVVTREDLVSALTPCLFAVPQFATFCIPLIQEKLDSTLKSAKIDSYNLLVEGCRVWPTEYLVPYCESLWLAIKQDTLPPRDTHIADSATNALQALVRAIPEPSLTSLLTSVIRSCEGFLSDVQLSLFEPSSRLFLAASQASPQACHIVSSKVLPGLVALLRVTQETSKSLVLNKLTAIIQVCLLYNIELDSGADSWRSLYDELIVCLQHGSVEVQQPAYIALALCTNHLYPVCRSALYSAILTHITSQQPQSLRDECTKCLQALAHNYGDEVQTNIVDSLTVTVKEEEPTLKQNKFEGVCSLAVIERFHEIFFQQFMTLVTQGRAYTTVAIACLRNLIEDEQVQTNSSLINFLFCQSSILPVLVSLKTEGSDLLNSARIIQILVRLQSSSEQSRIVKPIANKLLQHPDQTQQMVLLEAFVSPLRPDVSVLTSDEVSQVVVAAALHSSLSSNACSSALRLLACIINKSGDDKLLQLVSQQLQLCPVERATTVHAYITKALVVRGHPLGEEWLNKSVEFLDNEEVAKTAADGVRLIVEESEQFLNHQNHCHIRLLYRQRVFQMLVPQLVHSARKVQHLRALAYLLQAVPHTVYEHHIKQIMPLLVISLDTDCEKLLLTILHTLASLLSTSNSCLEDHIDTLIPRFLNLARHNPFMHVRMAALQCLYNGLRFSPILLLPRKQEVLSELIQCLDDKKRLVRKEAARTRAKWFILGAPTKDT